MFIFCHTTSSRPPLYVPTEGRRVRNKSYHSNNNSELSARIEPVGKQLSQRSTDGPFIYACKYEKETKEFYLIKHK